MEGGRRGGGRRRRSGARGVPILTSGGRSRGHRSAVSARKVRKVRPCRWGDSLLRGAVVAHRCGGDGCHVLVAIHRPEVIDEGANVRSQNGGEASAWGLAGPVWMQDREARFMLGCGSGTRPLVARRTRRTQRAGAAMVPAPQGAGAGGRPFWSQPEPKTSGEAMNQTAREIARQATVPTMQAIAAHSVGGDAGRFSRSGSQKPSAIPVMRPPPWP